MTAKIEIQISRSIVSFFGVSEIADRGGAHIHAYGSSTVNKMQCYRAKGTLFYTSFLRTILTSQLPIVSMPNKVKFQDVLG